MYIPRSELVELIVRNNMVEEFASWVKSVVGEGEPVSLWDVDYGLLLKFVVEKKLIELEEKPEYVKEAESVREVDDNFKHVEKRSMPRKIRRKT